jgi:hypothetical protein
VLEVVSKATGKFINRPTKTGDRVYDKFFIYIPTGLARDSAFPFKPGDQVVLELDVDACELRIRLVDGRATGVGGNRGAEPAGEGGVTPRRWPSRRRHRSR